MGISLGSTAAGVIVNGTKANQEPAATALRSIPAEQRRGVLTMNPAWGEAKLSDLFTGDELTNKNVVDISKLQMFFFTIAAVYGYAMILWKSSFPSKDGAAVNFPDISTSLVT